MLNHCSHCSLSLSSKVIRLDDNSTILPVWNTFITLQLLLRIGLTCFWLVQMTKSKSLQILCRSFFFWGIHYWSDQWSRTTALGDSLQCFSAVIIPINLQCVFANLKSRLFQFVSEITKRTHMFEFDKLLYISSTNSVLNYLQENHFSLFD